MNFSKHCPICNSKMTYIHKCHLNESIRKNRMCKNCKINLSIGTIPPNKGVPCSEETKLKIGASSSIKNKERYSNEEERKKTSLFVKKAMHRPEIRKKHLEGLLRSKWIKVRTDKGQLELIEKRNRLGFNFEPNYQVKTDSDLFYVDGYDKEKNVVLEYDSKYHLRKTQKEKDLIRQHKIINILKPNKFWRFNSESKIYKNILGD